MSDRRPIRPYPAPAPGEEIRRRARQTGPPPPTPLQGASRAATPPRPSNRRAHERDEPRLPPGAR